MKDVRGVELKDGDLVMKILDGGSSSNGLVYAVMVGDCPYYKKRGYEKAKEISKGRSDSNQLIKFEPTADELKIRDELLNMLAADKRTNFGFQTAKEIAYKLLHP